MAVTVALPPAAADQIDKRAVFKLCNNSPISLQVYTIRSLIGGDPETSLILGNLVNQERDYEGQGWRRILPKTCVTETSVLDLNLVLSVNYDFGDALHHLSLGSNDEDEEQRPYAANAIDTKYCVTPWDAPKPLLLKRDELDDFLPRNGACPDSRFVLQPFNLGIFVPKYGNYTIEYDE